MRYVALGILVWVLLALIICKIALIICKIKEFTFTDSLLWSYVIIAGSLLMYLIIYVFIKYW